MSKIEQRIGEGHAFGFHAAETERTTDEAERLDFERRRDHWRKLRAAIARPVTGADLGGARRPEPVDQIDEYGCPVPRPTRRLNIDVLCAGDHKVAEPGSAASLVNAVYRADAEQRRKEAVWGPDYDPTKTRLDRKLDEIFGPHDPNKSRLEAKLDALFQREE